MTLVNLEGNFVCKFSYFRIYNKITNISGPKVAVIVLSPYFLNYTLYN